LRVLIADAAPLQRAGLRTMLAARKPGGAPASPDSGSAPAGDHPVGAGVQAWDDDDPAPAEIVVAGEAGDGAEAVELARRLLPDLLITDLTLPRADGLAVARAITEANLPVRVLILTARDTDDEILAAVAAGATGYLCKDAPRDELVAAVRAVAAGGAVIAPPLLARILARVADSYPRATDNGASRLDALTAREREVLVHVARGRTNAEIADLLQVSETTVKTHVGHVLTKLRLRDRTQAVVLAYETGLVKPGA
jgi:DNA-binding NarL/FixJ family response regulator